MTDSSTSTKEILAAGLHRVLETSFRGEVFRVAELILCWLKHGGDDVGPGQLADQLAELACGDTSCLPALLLVITDVADTDGAPQLQRRLSTLLAELARAFDEYEDSRVGPAALDGVSEAGDRKLSDTFLQHVIDTVADPIFVKDRDHRWVLLNDAYCEFMGYSRDELLGKSDHDFFPADEADTFWQKDDLVFETGHPDENEERFTDADGREHIIVTKKQMFVHADGRKFLVGVIRDVTERRRLEARLSVARRLMSLGTLAGGVSHEINNPLSFLITNLEYVADTITDSDISPAEPPDDIAAALEAALRGAERVREIVNGLKTFSESADQEPEPIDIRDRLRSTVKITMNEIQQRARLVERYGQIPLVEANHRSLGQIFLNLLTNAIYAIEDGDVEDNEIRIVTTTDDDGRAVVEISDTGTGIPDDIIDKIFDPFFTTKPVGDGTGLGLAICHSLVEAMNGHIDVESEPGVGTTFRVVFPPHDRPLETDDPPSNVASSNSSDNESIDAADERPRILFIDDEPDFLDSVKRRFSPHFDVRCAQTATEAIERLSAHPPPFFELVISDVMMPEMNGRQFYEALADRAPAYLDYLVFVSGGVFDARLRRFLDDQDRPVLDKFFDVDDLYALLD